jgi:hypothetical protein
MSIVAAIREMLAKGMAIEDALNIAEAFETKPRSAGAARQARYRERQKGELDEAPQLRFTSEPTSRVTSPDAEPEASRVTSPVTSRVTPPRARVESESPDSESHGKKEEEGETPVTPVTPETTTSPRETPRTALLVCLSPDLAEAVVAHRQAKRAPLTLHAAHLLAKALEATGDPTAAANMMIEHGWQTIKPDWFEREKTGGGRSNGAGRKGSLVDAGLELQRRLAAEREQRERDMRTGTGGGPGDAVVRLLPGVGSK